MKWLADNDSEYSGVCALVADDDDDVRALLSAALRRAGFDVAEACDGDELLELFAELRASHGDQPAVIVSDIGMPGCDGLEATRVLRTTCPGVPIVLITAFADAFTHRSAEDAGATVVLPKPVDRSVLVRQVVRLTQLRQRGHDAAG